MWFVCIIRHWLVLGHVVCVHYETLVSSWACGLCTLRDTGWFLGMWFVYIIRHWLVLGHVVCVHYETLVGSWACGLCTLRNTGWFLGIWFVYITRHWLVLEHVVCVHYETLVGSWVYGLCTLQDTGWFLGMWFVYITRHWLVLGHVVCVHWETLVDSYCWFKSDLDRRPTCTKFNQSYVRTHDLQIMDNWDHVPKRLILTTEPWWTHTHVVPVKSKNCNLEKLWHHTIIRAAFVCLFVPLLLQGPLTYLRQTWWVYVGGPLNCPWGVLFWKA